MKKLLLLIVAPVLAAIVLVATNTTVVSAVTSSCADVVITNTGPGSNNQVYCSGNYTITVNCENETKAVLNVTQDAESGNATVTGNTNAGNAISGSALNDSELNAIIENSCELEDEDEAPEVPEEPAPTEPTTPEGEVQGEKTVTALPTTGTTTPLQMSVIIAGAVIAAVLIARVVLLAYARTQK